MTVPPSLPGDEEEEAKEGNKSEWKRGKEMEGALLMGFDGRQSYERVAAQSERLG